jgi:hypothetical protein
MAGSSSPRTKLLVVAFAVNLDELVPAPTVGDRLLKPARQSGWIPQGA